MSAASPAVRLLLADADPAARAFLAKNLVADGYDVIAVADAPAALAELTHGERPVSVVLADVNSRTLSLIDSLRDDAFRGRSSADVPLIALTKQDDPLHRTRLLERGADDVVPKPLSYVELRARVAAILRRTTPRQPAAVLRAGELLIDCHEQRVTLAGQPISLSPTEYQLLRVLGAEPTRVFTRGELLQAVWGLGSATRTRTLDSHASRLRAKLAAATRPLIVNVWGVGFALISA